MPTLIATTKPGKKYRSLKRPKVYEALRRQGHSKQSSARISNAQARKKAFTIDQLEAFVSSEHYDPSTAGLIALGIPELPRLKGEQIAPGITRIRGNLCNVHGRYGPCDKAASGGKKPAKGRAGRKPAKPKPTDAQRASERDTKRQQNAASVAQRMAESDTGLAPQASKNLLAFAQGQQPDAMGGAGLASLGLAERATDGSYRMTPTGRAVVSAMQAGDYQRAVDSISRGTDAQGKRQERQTAQQTRQEAARQRQQEVATRRQTAAAERANRQQERAQAKPGKKPAGGGGDGSKKPEARAVERPRRAAPAKRVRRNSAPSIGSVSSAAPKKKPSPSPPKAEQPANAPAKQIAPALQESVQALSDGKELSDDDQQALIRNGLAKLDKSGTLILTAAGMRATQKEYSFQVFKDASGRYRWVAQSSTAFQDRDKEIVSTKALADDCAFADKTGNYGPLRWWHAPGLDLGDCDFNAMHGRVLIESGTFKSEAIALKVAQAAPQLEISLGFLHLPTEPDASGVFHHIRRFERSLVPRGKASNRFTAFTVKEAIPMDEKKIAYLKTELKFSDADIAEIEARATATEKAADDAKTAFKADEPVIELPDVVINGVTYKALPPSPPTAAEAVKDDGEGDMEVMAEEPVEEGYDDNAETLSGGDKAWFTATMQEFAAQLMGALDLEKKVAGHVQTFMQPYQQQQATKDATDAERAEQVAQLQTSLKDTQDKLNELLGLQPAVKAERPSESTTNTIPANPWLPTDQQLMESVKHQVSSSDQFAFGDLVENLFGNQTPGQA